MQVIDECLLLGLLGCKVFELKRWRELCGFRGSGEGDAVHGEGNKCGDRPEAFEAYGATGATGSDVVLMKKTPIAGVRR